LKFEHALGCSVIGQPRDLKPGSRGMRVREANISASRLECQPELEVSIP